METNYLIEKNEQGEEVIVSEPVIEVGEREEAELVLEVLYTDKSKYVSKETFTDHATMGLWIENNISEIKIIDIVRYEQ